MIKYEDLQIMPRPDFGKAVKQFMTEIILMMREAQPEFKDCWVIGVCIITDLSNTDGIRFLYGGAEDVHLKKNCTYFVEVAP